MPSSARADPSHAQEADSEGTLPRGVGDGWGVSEAMEGFVTSLPRMSGASVGRSEKSSHLSLSSRTVDTIVCSTSPCTCPSDVIEWMYFSLCPRAF
jgi:hypothetical protein